MRWVSRIRRSSVVRAAGRCFVWVAGFALAWGLVGLAKGLLPDQWAETIVPAASMVLFIATGELALATWFYARRTAESLEVMEKQTSAVEMQVEAADRQRRATIRPVITFQNDLDDPEAWPRYEKDLAHWEAVRAEYTTPSKTKNRMLPPGDRPRPPGACLANEGNGVALRIEARAVTEQDEHLTVRAASLGVQKSHFVEGWCEQLRGARVTKLAAIYRDAEGTLYWTAARDMTSSEDPWRVGEGSLPPEYEIL